MTNRALFVCNIHNCWQSENTYAEDDSRQELKCKWTHRPVVRRRILGIDASNSILERDGLPWLSVFNRLPVASVSCQ